jgi:hypothetical protein
MPLVNSQKSLIHLYARAARLDDATYRNYLRACAGVSSAADPKFPQGGFDDLMAALERELAGRADRGEVPDPVRPGGRIRNLTYWQSRRPSRGVINSRQAWRIQKLWTDLQPLIPPEHRTVDYLCRIVHKATGKRDTGYAALTASEANALIDALTDRINHAENPLYDRQTGAQKEFCQKKIT